MRTDVDFGVVVTDAIERSRRRPGKSYDGVIADATVEDIAEKDDRFAGAGKGDGNAAAFARVVARDRRCFERAAGPIVPGERQRRASIGFVLGFRGRHVTFIDPGGEDAAVGIERHSFKALARRTVRHRLRSGEGFAIVRRPDDESVAVIFLITRRIREDQTPAGTSDDLRSSVGTIVERQCRRRQCRRLGKRFAVISRTRDRDAAARSPRQPKLAVRRKGRRCDAGAGQRRRLTRCGRRRMMMHVLCVVGERCTGSAG